MKTNNKSISKWGKQGLLWFAAALGVVILLFFFFFKPSWKEQISALEIQKKQWVADMREAFPQQSYDPVELKKRLDYYQETGNKIGEQVIFRALGNDARNTSQFRLAIENHTAALQIGYEIGDTIFITTVLNELGTDFRRIGALNEAAPYHYLSLRIAEEYGGEDRATISRNMASSYNGLGVIYHSINEEQEAIRSYEKALEIEIGNNNLRGIAMNYANIGSVYFDMGDQTKAEEYYRRSLDYNEKANLPLGIALCLINIGHIYEAQGDDRRALTQYEEAYELLSDTSDRWHWLNACFSIGKIHLKSGQLVKAWPYLDAALRTASAINSPQHIKQAYELRSEYHHKRGDFKQSVDDLRISRAYADTLQQNQETGRLLDSRVKYETEKYAKQIEELDELNREQEAKRKATLLLMTPVILGLLILLLLILYKRRLERQQTIELKNIERMRSNFFTHITHEFRTPITVITGLSDHILSTIKETDSPEAKDLKAIRRQGRNLMHLVNQLLDFSRSEAGVSKPRWRQGDLVEYLHVIAEPYAQYARSREIDLFVYSEVDTLSMNFIASSVKKVMSNLLSNAIKHCSAGDKIVVHLRHDKAAGQCVIQVKDTGEGITPERLPHIFELYYTSDAENGDHVGSGIGLALSKQLVEEAGGMIGVSSTVGKGTEFTLSLPVSNDPIPVEAREELNEEDAGIHLADLDTDGDENTTPGKASNTKKMILIVEDNKDVAHYMHTILAQRYTLIHASNGNEGLLMAEQHIPDLIITDVMMPEKDGYAFTADLRASIAVAHIPVIMVTAKGTTEDKLDGLRVGADAYLAKPFDERELLVRIKQLLDSRAMLMKTYANALFQAGTASHTDPNMAFITKLSSVVNSHLNDADYFPTGLAQDMCLSESQLGRKLKAMTGHTITSFVMQARLNKAKLLLSKRDRSIKEVAFDCGFSDLSYFSRSFRKAFGYTPSQFIKIPEERG
ncbi:two-component system sensor histidine kinase ChiS [Parabacteroides sp. PFB2-10]|uniref:ATP-binding protein n=1 Tax=Parabacteroides sp. PFB2-10 TaxID=1742405 RepID=UPI0024730A0F|nr:ATP-binding protein [Parabacteroides sp. PFB2-10]MDH6313126.1 two-component system sensor histidine kinase ChiS [Parabacteroides sp. PFB2-10]MDL2244105.1 tetratricopeptide repeat protein [Parabacteroides sp. OttesenSCG-928-J18]